MAFTVKNSNLVLVTVILNCECSESIKMSMVVSMIGLTSKIFYRVNNQNGWGPYSFPPLIAKTLMIKYV